MFSNSRNFVIQDNVMMDASQSHSFTGQSNPFFDQSQSQTIQGNARPIFDHSQSHSFHAQSNPQFFQRQSYSFHDNSRPIIDQSRHFDQSRQYFNQSVNGLTGKQLLYQGIAADAMHDYHDACDAPKCHPETRKGILSDLFSWIADRNKVSPVLWLSGPAGSGKTAIQRTLAERGVESGYLGATFFFSRTAPSRNHPRHLFSTIAYQLMLNIPPVKPQIESVVMNDPSIVTKSTEMQLQRLIVEPIASAAAWITSPFVVIIDGLDECLVEHIQCLILRLVSATASLEKFPLCFLLSSRRESHIAAEFNTGILSRISRELSLADCLDADQDITTFLKSGFARISEDSRHRHTMAFVRRPWPRHSDIQMLVRRASRQFVYPSTVLKFVDDPDRDPDSQLSLVLSVNGNLPGAFPELDALYLEILSQCASQPHTIEVLRFLVTLLSAQHYLMVFGDIDKGQHILSLIEQLLDLNPGRAHVALRRLHSLIRLPSSDGGSEDSRGIEFHHASFPDFLCDSKRSGNFFVEIRTVHADITRCCLRKMTQISFHSPPHEYVAWCYAIAKWDRHCVCAASNQELMDALYHFDLVSNWLEVASLKSSTINWGSVRQAIDHMRQNDGIRPAAPVDLQPIDQPDFFSRFLSQVDLRQMLYIFEWLQNNQHLKNAWETHQSIMLQLDSSFLATLSVSPQRDQFPIVLSVPPLSPDDAFYSCMFLKECRHFYEKEADHRESVVLSLKPLLVLDDSSSEIENSELYRNSFSAHYRLDGSVFRISEIFHQFLNDPSRAGKFYMSADKRAFAAGHFLRNAKSLLNIDVIQYTDWWTYNLSLASPSRELVNELRAVTKMYLQDIKVYKLIRSYQCEQVIEWLQKLTYPPIDLIDDWDALKRQVEPKASSHLRMQSKFSKRRSGQPRRVRRNQVAFGSNTFYEPTPLPY